MDIKVISNEEDFLSLKEAWNELSKDLITVNSFDWQFAWWKHNKKNNKLNILVAEKNGKIVGIAPLYIMPANIFKVFNFNKACFLGGDISDYLDFLISKDDNREEIFKALLNFTLDKLPCDYIGLGQINSHYPNFDLWQKYAASFNLEFESYRECHKIDLSKFSSADDYIDSLSKNLRKDLRRIQNKAERDFGKVEFVFKDEITQKDIETIANIHIKRQKTLYEKGSTDRFCYFTDKKKNNFMLDYFSKDNYDSRTLIYLKFNDKIAAYDLILKNKDSISFWNGTIDIDFEKYSPTKLITTRVVSYAFEKNIKILDFLRGDDPYKLQWCNDMSLNYNLSKRKSLRTKIIFHLRDLTPKSVLVKLKTPDIREELERGYEIPEN